MSKSVLLVDLETRPNLAYCWGKYEQNVLSIEEERDIISYAWKWLGEKKVKVLCSYDLPEKEFFSKLHELFDKADIIIGHNIDGFDAKVANTAFIKHGFKPPSPIKTIDTLKIARSKFFFNSNHLNDLGEILGCGKKVETGGFKLWKGYLNKDKKSIRLMKRYNQQDVSLLDAVYHKLKAWGNTPFIELGMSCPACGGFNLQQRGWQVNKVFMTKRLQCTDCGKWTTSSIKIKHEKNEYVK